MTGRNVFHDGSLFARIKVLNAETCVIITDYEDVRGYLSTDGKAIDWEDGDCWRRVAAPQSGQYEELHPMQAQKGPAVNDTRFSDMGH